MDVRELTATNIVDFFIGDCLMPDKYHTLTASELYDIFLVYCDQTDIGVPCSIKFFGACLSDRFQRRRVRGRSQYFCSFKPGLFDVTT